MLFTNCIWEGLGIEVKAFVISQLSHVDCIYGGENKTPEKFNTSIHKTNSEIWHPKNYLLYGIF